MSSSRDERVARLVFEAKAKNFDQLDRALKKTGDNTEKIAEIGKMISAEYARAGDKIEDALGNAAIRKANDNWNDALESVQEYVKELDRAEAKSQKLATSTKGAAGANFGGATQGIRSLARTAGLGGLSEGIDVGADIAELAADLPKLKLGFENLPAAARAAIDAIGAGNVGMIGGIAAATIAIKLLADQADRVKDSARAQIDAQTNYFAVVASGTTESITALKKEAEERVKSAAAAAEHAKNINTQLEQDLNANLNPLERALLDFNTAIGTGGGELQATRDAVDATNKELIAAQAAAAQAS